MNFKNEPLLKVQTARMGQEGAIFILWKGISREKAGGDKDLVKEQDHFLLGF